jgi:hypothetical protein
MVKSAQRLDAYVHLRRHCGPGRNPMMFRQRAHFYFAHPNVIVLPICAAGIVNKDNPPLPEGEGGIKLASRLRKFSRAEITNTH